MVHAPTAGFRDPPSAAQRHFRRLLDAMSRPGRIVALDGELPVPPRGLATGTFALLLALADFETPVWLDPGVGGDEVQRALRFHCGCPIVRDPAAAVFAVSDVTSVLPVERFRAGSPEYPDRSTTLLVATDGFAGGPAARLTGPGVDGETILPVAAAPAGFWPALRSNHERFPQGVDMVLVAGDRVVGLPRSTEIEVL